MTTHDPALCLKTACDLCDVYAEGYSRGKDAAYSEIQARLCSGTPRRRLRVSTVLDSPAYSARVASRVRRRPRPRIGAWGPLRARIGVTG